MRLGHGERDIVGVEFDLCVSGGTVIDGTGAGRFRADVGVVNGRIAAVSRDAAGLHAARRIDATGKIVAPGFVDSNSHVDWIAPLPRRRELLAPMLLQGITTSVGGGCGYSAAPVPRGREDAVEQLSGFLHDDDFRFEWSSFGEYLSVLESERPPVNLAFLVGQNTVRDVVRGVRAGPATREELRVMRQLTIDALHEGAYGISGNAGMRPGRYATDDELVTLARAVGQEGGICAVHARAYTSISDAYPPLGAPHNVRAVRDLIAVARKSGVRLQISHLLFAGRRTWRTADTVMDDLDQARSQGVEIAFDAIPYTVSAGPLELIFPAWFVSRFPNSARSRGAALRLKAELAIQRAMIGIDYRDLRLMSTAGLNLSDLEGLDFAAIARRLDICPVDAEVEVARRSGMRAMVMFDTCSGTGDDDPTLRRVLSDPSCAFITNAVTRRHGAANPAAFGAFPRILGRFSRDLGLFSLEEAIRRMTSYPAERVGLQRVGRVAEGYAADLVVFDPDTVGPPPSVEVSRPRGIDTVIVSGAVAASGGQIAASDHGRVLRSSR